MTKDKLSITGIQKEDPLLLGNDRPISLLCVDVKIATRALARVAKSYTKIVSSDQHGYIKNIFIGYNLRLIQDITDYSEK